MKFVRLKTYAARAKGVARRVAGKILAKVPKKVLVGATFFVLLIGATFLLNAKLQPAPYDPEKIVTESVRTPSEAEISPSYSVPAKQPLSIEIADANIKGFIQKVGVDQNQAVTAPNNVNLAGWFTDSVSPGNKGLSIIDGHVDGYSQAGIFHNLKNVKKGSTVVITFGDKSTRTFTVFNVESVPEEKAAALLFNQDPTVSSQLNIITCTGKYDSKKHSYADRVIVYAKLTK